MLEQKKLVEAEKRIRQYLAEGSIIVKAKPEHTSFFLKHAADALDSASVLYEISTDAEKQKLLGFTSFNGLLWTVNASYYSMFYMARALIEREGIRIKADLSVHAITFDTIISFFYVTGKLQKGLLDDFADAKGDAAALLGKQRADELIEEYYYEKSKRSSFTYEMGALVVQSKAKTSLDRARKFMREIKKIMLRNT
ncbi:hypothetical protein HZB02_03940 [Candidatus Woesearchaeota archaeon]|nr:hypothetical protein [Candidatus Woesearchaeota archaeon]